MTEENNKFEIETVIISDGNKPLVLPNQKIEPFDMLITSIPLVVTALIVVSAAYVNYRSNRKSIESQNKIAHLSRAEEHANKISEFRHSWIQEVREVTSYLCQIMHVIQVNTVLRNVSIENAKQARNNDDKSMELHYSKKVSGALEKLISKRSEYHKTSSKLKLLFKNGDASTKEVFKLIDAIKEEIYDFDKTSIEENKIEEIVLHFQDILKREWEVTKERSWHKNI